MTASSVATNVLAGTTTSLPALEVRRKQRQAQRIQAARDSDSMGGSAVGGERVLELRDLRAVDERPIVDDLGEPSEDVAR